MVDDLADAQKLVIELQAANAALTAKVERLQSAGQMEQAQGSRSGLGVAPGVWQVWTGAAGWQDMHDSGMHLPCRWSRLTQCTACQQTQRGSCSFQQ